MISISQFPRKKTVDRLPEPIKIVRKNSREFKQDSDNFDPFISSSPSNNFMEKLTERYEKLGFSK